MSSDNTPEFVQAESRGWFVVMETRNHDGHIASDYTVEVEA